MWSFIGLVWLASATQFSWNLSGVMLMYTHESENTESGYLLGIVRLYWDFLVMLGNSIKPVSWCMSQDPVSARFFNRSPKLFIFPSLNRLAIGSIASSWNGVFCIVIVLKPWVIWNYNDQSNSANCLFPVQIKTNLCGRLLRTRITIRS